MLIILLFTGFCSIPLFFFIVHLDKKHIRDNQYLDTRISKRTEQLINLATRLRKQEHLLEEATHRILVLETKLNAQNKKKVKRGSK